MRIFDQTMSLLEKALDLRGSRHQVIAANIANEETPGYRAKELRFLDTLASAVHGRDGVALRVTDIRHLGPRGENGIARVAGKLADVPTGDLPLDANSVNLELEMAKLSDNAMHYSTASQIVALRYRQLLSAIRDSR
jgi:flagellar basal-body rod protein FlgB